MLRPSFLLGPGTPPQSVASLLVDWVAHARPAGGLNCADVRDVVAAFVAAADHPAPALTYLLGGHDLSWVDAHARLTALRPASVPTPRWSMRRRPRVDPVVVEMARHFWYVDPSRARADLGWSPRALEATLSATLSAAPLGTEPPQ